MSDSLTITLLGSPSVSLNGRSLQFGSVKAIALLAYLATSSMLHDRSELAALLWPESNHQRGRGALRYTLSMIKKAVGDGFLLVNRRQIGMNPAAAWEVDVATLRRLLAPALGGETTFGHETLAGIEKGVSLYQADFCQGFTLRDSDGFNEWVRIQSETLGRDVGRALKRLVVYYQAAQRWETAVSYAHRWLDLNPLHEPAHGQLMQLYAELGDWTAVHNQYQSLADMLERELGVSPQLETTAIYQNLCQRKETAVVSIPLTQLTPEQRSRRVLIKKVRRFWVDSLLTPLRAQDRFIRLKLQFANETIAHPWADVLDTAHRPNATTITQAFHNADRALLILGAPGAGKTISLVELANELLTLARENDAQPVPVILNLSSWPEGQRDISTWAVEEMVAKYQIPRRIGRRWLANDRLLFLLDGLDEMPSDSRADCIVALNHFRHAHGLADLVVCCRQAAYELACAELAEQGMDQQAAGLQLNGAVQIRPLTTAQIRQHLPPSLVTPIFNDDALLELAQSPLNLTMIRTALGQNGDIPKDPTRLTYHNLLDHYVQRMFQRQADKGNGRYDTAEMSAQLRWLAHQMQQHNQSIFLIEQIQPSWLGAGSRAQWLYLWMTRSVMAGLLGAPILWGFVQLIGINPPFIEVHFFTWLAAQLGVTAVPWNSLVAIAIFNLFIGTIVTLLDSLFFHWRRQRGDSAKIDRRLGWLHFLTVGGVAGIVTVLVVAQTDVMQLAIFLGGAEMLGSVLALGYIAHGQSYRTEIRTLGAMQWSWRNAGIWGGVGATFSLAWSGIIWLNDPSAVAWQLNLVSNSFMFFLLGGVSGKRTEAKNRPNEGMRIAAKNGLFALVLVALPIVGITAVTVNLPSGIYTGLMIGLAAATAHGFNDLFKHITLRLLLWRESAVPLNYVQLLDDAADAVLLQKVGGGYTFRHRLLQEHFSNKE